MKIQINHVSTHEFDVKTAYPISGKEKGLIILPLKAGEQTIKLTFKNKAEVEQLLKTFE